MLELLVASSIFLIVSSTIMSAVFGGRALTIDSEQASIATEYAQEGLAAARLLRDQNWNNLSNGTFGLTKSGGSWQLSGSSDTQNGYTRTLTIAPNSANSKLVTSKVTWQVTNVRQSNVTFSTLLTNWANTQVNNFIDGDWVHPTSAGIGDIDQAAAGTDVVVQNKLAYVSAASSNQAKPDLVIFDVTNPNGPIQKSMVDLGVSNITAIAKSGNFLYGAIGGSTNEFMVIDVANPVTPFTKGQFDISNGVALSITVNGTMLYLGMQKITSEPEFYAVDVSNPTAPVVRGSFEVSGDVNSIQIFNNRAYLATSVDNAELIVLDLTNPAAITKLGQFDAPQTPDGRSVFVKDEFNIYLGREVSNTTDEFVIVNAGSPGTITQRGSYDLATGINDMVAVNKLVFMVTEQPNAEFRVLDVGNPSSIYSFSYLNFPQSATGIAYENNTIYSSVRSNNALRILRPS